MRRPAAGPTGRLYFGTDGVRGVVGDDLTEDLVERLGVGFGLWSEGGTVLVGRDTRASGPALERTLARGLTAAGANVALGGVLPTPAVALLADGPSAVVSASHNPPEYNGVKFFANGGIKLTDEQEEAIEERMAVERRGSEGAVEEPEGLADRYLALVCERFGASLGGLRVVVDCANGAMSDVGPAALERLGATVVSIANEPDGRNINVRCGATSLGLLSEAVRTERADLGVAFDGDGDRVLAVDAGGREVDGDQIVAVLALHLGVDLVAVTAMTNLGFHQLMEERGVRVVTTDVGDRYVLEALRREGGVLGGEEAGHIIYLDGHVTGDGLVGAVLLARAVVEEQTPLEELASVLRRYPQAKVNVPAAVRTLPEAVRDEVAALNETLAGEARVLVRPSGTEPLIRVLAEAGTEAEARTLAAKIARLVESQLG